MSRVRLKVYLLVCVSVSCVLIWILSQRSLLLNPLGYSTAVVDRHGALLRVTLSSDQKYRMAVSLDHIAPSLIDATLKKEDRYFFWHPGVNPVALLRAACAWVVGKRGGGASTITMQYARLRFDLSTKSVVGKLQQVIYALFLELSFSKRDILEAYFNIAPYGRNIEGIEAASSIYYQTHASQILPPQAAKLVQLPQLPTKRSKELFPQTNNFAFEAPHFVDRVLAQYPLNARLETSLDLVQQKNAEHLVSQFIERHRGRGVQNAAVMIASVHDNSISTYIGSADFFDTALHGQVNGCAAKRSPGSSLKPFIYALAADRGLIHTQTKLVDTVFNKSTYNPENFEKNFIGPISATDALVHSRNIPAIFLLNQILPETFRSFLLQAGVSKIRDAQFYGLSLALGGVEVSQEELVALYGMLANNGVYRPLSLRHDAPKTTASAQLISSGAAYLILQMLSENPLPESRATLQPRGAPVAWKTGTSFGFRDAWATAVVGDSIVSVWLGNFNGTGNPVFVGRELAGELLFELVEGLSLNSTTPQWMLHRPSSVAQVDVCATSGELPEPYCPHTRKALFLSGVSPRKRCSVHRMVYKDGTSHVVEVWPSDVLKLFADAGIPRRDVEGQASAQGKMPLITSPQQTLTYLLSPMNDAIPLSAVIDGDSQYAFWFVDALPIARVPRGETYYWQPAPGQYTITVTDEHGRSQSVLVRVALKANS